MTAVNEARMDMAMGNVDQQKIKIEMGLAAPQASGASAVPDKTIGGKEPQKN